MHEPGRIFVIDEYLQDKKIVIYGAGLTGRQLYSQLKDRGIDVIAVVDRNADVIENSFSCPLIKPEAFFYNHFSQYYFFIANVSVTAKDEIRKYLIEHGVEETGILDLEENFYDGVREYQMKDDPDEALHQLIQANENIIGNIELTEHFQIWMNVYYSKLTDKEGFRNEIKYEFHNNSKDETRIMLGLYLFELKELDAVGMQDLVDCISKLPEGEYDWLYFLTIQIHSMEFTQNRLIYKELGADRKAMWERILRYYCPKCMLELDNSRRIKGKIAILIPDFLGENHAPAMIYRMMANALSKEGKKVKIFVISEYAGQKSFGFLSVQRGLSLSELSAYDQYNKEKLNPDIEIEYIAKDTIVDLLRTTVNEVIKFSPQCIIDATNERSPVSGILIKYFPVLCYATATGTAGTFFTKTTVNLFEYNMEIAPYRVTLPYFFIEKSESVSYNKKDRLGIPEDSFVIVTVGRRLYSELDQELSDCVVKLLKKHTDMYWLLVGNTEVGKYFNKGETENRVLVIPYEENLKALYSLCDVFLNPDRTGGGFSMMFAMQKEVMVTALKKNLYGAARWVGEEELIEGGYAQLCEYIEKLYQFPDLLREKKKRMREIIYEKCNTKKWVIALCDVLDSMEQSFAAGRNNNTVLRGETNDTI